MAKFISGIIFILMLFASTNVFAYDDVCSIETRFYERKYDIQPSLLTAVSIVETGRWSSEKGEKTPWPWTINAEGKGMFFASKAEAIREVIKLQKQGIESIDVGCMQINLKYHPNAFKSLDEAFDPSFNVEYASQFLKSLYEKHNSWFVAVRHYHSALSEKNVVYGNKILSAFENLNGNKKDLKAEVAHKVLDAKKYANNFRTKMLEKYRKNKEKSISVISKNENSV